MDEIIEIMLDIIFDIGTEMTNNKKIPKTIRYIIAILLILITISIIIIIIVSGIFLLEKSLTAAIAMFLIAIAFIISIIIKTKKYIKNKE